MDLQERKAKVEHMIATANLLDDQGNHDLADQITRLAAKEVEDIEDDVDAENADSPVADGDKMSKGFGKSVGVLAKKLAAICNSNNCHKKLEALCDGSECDADELYMALRKAHKLLAQLG